MKFNRKSSCAAGLLSLVATGVASAAPTTPTTPTNAAELAQSVDLAGVTEAGMIIFGLLIGVGVVLWAGRMVVRKFSPRF